MDVRDGLQPSQGKVLRAPSLKRGRPEERITDRVKLERVLGVTVGGNAALTSDPNTETVAYPAGCTVVLLNTKTATQNHIINASKKTITSLAYSSCGRYLVTGECGHQPAVRVWDLQAEVQTTTATGTAPQVPQIAEFVGHKYGVNCVAFSPSNKYVVSIGSQHDMIVNVWDWRNNIKVASNKVSTKVKAVAFAENGNYFVTVGNRHVKFWYLEYGKAKYKEAVPLMGRSAILGEQRNNYFCDVACGRGVNGDSTYTITRTGLLCEFNNRRLLDKWVELRTASANCMSIGERYIFVGCADGIVRCFDPSTLQFVTTLPRTHYLGVDVSQGLSISHMSAHPQQAKYPDAVAVTYDETNNKLTVVYNDHSIYVWAVRDIKRVGKSHSFLYHSACIWGVEMAPRSSPLPPGSFLTCSSDDTIRVWTLDRSENANKGIFQKNIYSNDLLKVVYIDQEMTYLKDLDLSATAVSNDKSDTSYDSRNGVRSIRLSPDGRHLASGDRAGNIRVHDTATMTEKYKIEAHDAEVLCLEYSQDNPEQNLLASASRDRLIHVFDVENGYNFLQTLDDHSSSITAVRFLNSQGNIQMVSCGADKSIIFRQLSGSPQGAPQFARGHNAAGKATLYDMEIDAGQKHVLTACQDRNVRVYSVHTGKHTKTFKGSTGDDGSLIKVVLDKSGIYVATSCTDKTLSVYDYYSGECMASMCGHSELATGLRFTDDCRRLISASGDGCIFVWKVPHDMVVTMQARLSQQAMRQGKTLDTEIFGDGPRADFVDPDDIDNRFSMSALPLWAKKQIADDTSPPISLNRPDNLPKGRWAQRAEKTMSVKSVYTDSMIAFPSLHDRKLDSDGSKDSSIDSGTDSRGHYGEMRRELTAATKTSPPGFTICSESYNELMETTTQSNSSNITIREHRRTLLTDDSALGSLRDPDLESTAHDGDIEDISDQENRHAHTTYYPTQQDSASGSEFPVNAMDVDELRKSQRKAKRMPDLPLVSVTTASVSGSQDSDDDDDEASTPSGENTDRNPMSMFSVSSESLDQIVHREKYLQSTFESLSGTEMETSFGKTSISAQHHTRNGGVPVQLRNVAVINAAKQFKSDPEASRKREELNKRIEETRRKLQSVGYRSSLKSSQSITDLHHVPEKDNWHAPSRQSTGISSNQFDPGLTNLTRDVLTYPVSLNRCSTPSDCEDRTSAKFTFPSSCSVPSDLQLCGCYLKDIAMNTCSYQYIPKVVFDACVEPPKLERPRRLKLPEKPKYKLHKSLPVSPVSEECRFSDFAQDGQTKQEPRRSFSYFVDLDSKSTEEGLLQVCSDIEKFSQTLNYDMYDLDKTSETKPTGNDDENDDDDGNFSSDSLEDCSFGSTRNIKKTKKYSTPRRCYSNNEIYNYGTYDDELDVNPIPKSQTSFYLNQSNRNSRESMLSDELGAKSYCNSLESVLSDESECRSAPLEVLFAGHRKRKPVSASNSPYHQPSTSMNIPITRQINELHAGSLPTEYFDKNYISYFTTSPKRSIPIVTPSQPTEKLDLTRSKSLGGDMKENIENIENQNPVIKIKKSNTSYDFQQKLLKFETGLVNQQTEPLRENTKKSIAYFIEAPKVKEKKNMAYFIESVREKFEKNTMDIPSLKTKNIQYNSKYRNVLNNKPEIKPEMLFSDPGNASISKDSAVVHRTREEGKSNTLESTRNGNGNCNERQLETTSLDRHILNKPLWDTEKVVHKPPKAVRRHSSKTYSRNRNRRLQNNFSVSDKTVAKAAVNFDRNVTKNNKLTDSDNNPNSTESVIELHYKEKNKEVECESGPKAILADIYDSLDKLISDTKIEQDSLESLNVCDENFWGKSPSVIEAEKKNVWRKHEDFDKISVDKSQTKLLSLSPSDLDKIQSSIENIKLLHEIQQKVHKINVLVDAFKENITQGKVKVLSRMYETLSRSQIGLNNITEISGGIRKKRNLSLPNFVERNLSVASTAIQQFDKNLNANYRKRSDRSPEDEPYKKPPNLNVEKALEIPKNKKIDTILKKFKGFELLPSRAEALLKPEPESSLRRACSLSDLSVPGYEKQKIQVSGKVNKPTVPARTNLRNKTANPITRSSSTGVLNQSDSESESAPRASNRNSLMRPTISSQNKVANPKTNTNRRRIQQSMSTMNLSTVGQEDSSSEETPPSNNGKPAIPPRPRSMAIDQPLVAPRRHQPTIKDKSKINRYSSALELSNKENDVNVKTAQISSQLCKDVADQLTRAADNVVTLFRRLNTSETSDDNFASGAQKKNLAKLLESSVAKTQSVLQEISKQNALQNGSDNQHEHLKKLNELASISTAGDQTSVINLMHQYSDILLNVMQQKMANANK